MIALPEILAARERIRGHVRHTPTERNRTLSQRFGMNVYLKMELLQTTGAFKVRGALNCILALSPQERERGVVAVSGGNHAQGCAYAARMLGVRAVVLMPQTAPQNSITATRQYGAEVVLTTDASEAFERVQEYTQAGMTFIHPFDDPRVMAGQGTVGLEMLWDVPQLTDVIVSIGGGGLMSGVTSALKALKPGIRVWGVETEGADAMRQALAAGTPVKLDRITSIAKTLAAPSVSQNTLEIAQTQLERLVVVSDAETVRELKFLLERTKLLCEPAASCTVAALERVKAELASESHVGLILCGGNISLVDLIQWEHDFGLAD